MNQLLFDLITVHLPGGAQRRWMIAVAQHAIERLPDDDRAALLHKCLQDCFPPDRPPAPVHARAFTYRLLARAAETARSLAHLYATMAVAFCVAPEEPEEILFALLVSDYATETASALGGTAARNGEHVWQVRKAREYAPAHTAAIEVPGALDGEVQ